MKVSKEKLYQKIAKACLQAINQTADNKINPKDASKKVYDAIDIAFQKQHKILLNEYERMQKALTDISKLPPGSNSKALSIAQNAINNSTH
ncbi:MAG: hypothetical protein JKY24_07190 [Pseudomonadales bacterium]|nr:hypothetical protein [Pseudomonadales bacterium]